MSVQGTIQDRLCSSAIPATCMRVVLITIAFIMMIGIGRSRVQAGAYTVCASGCAYTSIQNAVDAASSGDTITIGPGVYHESIQVDRSGGTAAGPYSGGAAYLSGGGSFNIQPSSDGNFKVVTGATNPKELVSNTVGAVDSYNYWGQSFTVPSGASDLNFQAFSFLKAGGVNPSGGGIGYLFTKEHTGTVSSLSSTGKDLVASASWDVIKKIYDFSSSGVTLVPGLKYWFYSDSPLYVGTGSMPTASNFKLTLLGAGMEQTVIDGDNRDVILRVGSQSEVIVKDLTMLNGGVPTYPDGVAFSQSTVLVNLLPETWYTPKFDIDVNFELLAASATEPFVSIDYGVEESLAHWGQSFKVPAKAKSQKVTGFRFLRGDGATAAGAGKGYLFVGHGCLGKISCLTTDPAVVASGSWNGSYYDLSGSNYNLIPGTMYWFYSDTAFYAGMMAPKSNYNCGGGINNQGSLSLTKVTVGDSKSATFGGGVCMLQPTGYNPTTQSSLTIMNSIIGNNTSIDGGGGIYAADKTSLKVSGSFIVGNSSYHGGGIFSGGGLAGFTQTTITDTVVADNIATWWGGGIFNGDSSLTIKESWLSNNEAGHKGGAIVNAASEYGLAALTVDKSSILENKVKGASFSADGGGGIFNGEAIFGNQTSAYATIQNSTISGNKVMGTTGNGGGVKSIGKNLSISASTLSGNGATAGGGIAVTPAGLGSASIAFSTIFGNDGGGIYNTGVTTLSDTIVAKNGGKDCVWPLSNWPITSNGRNLDSDGSCKLSHSGDMSSIDPLLGLLEPNGGPTWTHAPLPGSPVIDAYSAAFQGEAYLSGGGNFVKFSDSDGNFEMWTKGTPPQKLVSYTGGTSDNFSYWGQSFVIPTRATNLELHAFNFLRGDGSTVSGGGVGYLFDSAYTDTPANLAAGSYLAKASWSRGSYDFSQSNLTLVPGKKYWFYSDQPVYVGLATAPSCPAGDQRGISRPQDGDGDGIAVCDMGAVEVAMPQADPGGPYVVGEGSTIQLNASGTIDPDNDASTLIFGWDLDDDGVFNDGATITSTLPLTNTLDGPTSVPIGLQVADDLGFVDIAHTTVQVVNVAPTATFTRTSKFVFVGEAAVVEFRDSSDPSSIDTQAGFTYFVDCDFDGTFTPDHAGTSTSYSCVYSSTGFMPVSGVVEDKDGGFNEYLVEVPVISPQEGIGYLAFNVANLEAEGYLNHKEERDLNQLLDAALQKLNQGKKNLAASKLSVFSAKVGEYMAKGVLTPAQGQSLIDLANRVIATINSSP